MPPRTFFSTAYDPVSAKVVVFGGSNASGQLNETWTFDGTTWTQVQPSISPGPRAAAAMAYDQSSQKVDSVRHTVVLFGGISDNWIVQNTWTWDGTNWTLRNPAAQPPPLYFTTGGFDPILKEAVVFGGGSEGVDQNTTWAWDGRNWTLLSPIASPAAREGFGTVWDPGPPISDLRWKRLWLTSDFWGYVGIDRQLDE